MAKMKVSEIAKSLNISNKELIQFLNENGFKDIKSANKNIEDEAIALILKNFSPKKEKVDKEEKKEEIETQIQQEKVGKTPMEKKTEQVEQKTEKKAYEKKTGNNRSYQDRRQNTNQKYSQNNSQGQNTNQKYSQNNSQGQNTNQKYSQNNSQGQNTNQKYSQNNSQGQNTNQKYSQNNSQGQNTDQKYNQNNSQGQNTNQKYSQNNNQGRSTNQKSGQNTNTNQRTRYSNQGQNGNQKYNTNQRGTNQNQTNRQKPRPNQESNQNNRNNINATLSSFATTPMPTKNNSNRSNGYNKKNNEKNIERETRNNKKIKEKDPNRKGAFIMPKPAAVKEESEDTIRTIIIPESLTIKELADKMKTPAANIVKKLLMQGKIVSINQELSFEEAEEIALEFNCITELEKKVNVIEEILKEEEEEEGTMKKRPPVVCVMGHVDHGKTSLLDAIRETNVTSKEAGGITQHIGAYVVEVNGEKITFLDTPGHEAFTSMRMRGAKSTDIAILVVAADDGVMPQTIEAINHAKAAGIEIIVAINKIDKPSANIERVKQELVEYELVAEDWGGNTIFVPVSAHTKEGLEQLLEMILLTAEIAELKANPDRKARGIVIEARLDKGRGPVATILVQKGILHVGDCIVIGCAHGKVRAMMDDKGKRVKEAGPSMPVEIIGLNEVPVAGEIFMVMDNEKEARSVADAYIKQSREKLLDDTKAKLSLDGLFSQIQAGNIKELNLIVKADVQGSVEAIKQSLLKLSNEEVAIRIIHGGVGNITESDVTLASASNAIIIGFNVKPDSMAKEIAEREKVDLRLYHIIYNAIEDIESAMKGLLDPIFEEKVLGHAEIRQVFKASGLGAIAGSYVLDGKIIRGSKARIRREGELIFEGDLASLKRFKDDVKEVMAGYECGLVFEKFNDIKEADQVEIYIMEEVPR